jgi:hypothetical protein
MATRPTRDGAGRPRIDHEHLDEHRALNLHTLP